MTRNEPASEQQNQSTLEEGSIPIQATPPPAQVKRETKRPMTPERLGMEIARLDRLLVWMVLLLAVFLASFTAQNADVWLHLATGRLIAQGHYHFGVDPFAYTTAEASWANHAWLTDWLMYVGSQALGGPESPTGGASLIWFKAALVTALAWVLLRIRRADQSLWAPVVGVALALLAMSPRLLLQPACVAFLFLGLTLYGLTRWANHGDRRLFLLPLLFAAWSNLDHWFLLGPITVGLFLFGELLQDALAPLRTADDAPAPGARRRLTLVLLLGLAACSLNPHHVQSFALPPDLELLYSESGPREDPLFRTFFLSPFAGDDLKSPAGLAYLPLVLLTIGSFAINYKGWHWWRLTVWLPFFVLSLSWARGVPFLAVVSAPIAALNLQDFAARFGTAPRVDGGWRHWSLFGRSATAAALGALLFLDWPGWLHSRPDLASKTRRVHWALAVDPSLRQATEQLALLRRQGVLQANGFLFSPDIASYCAWFCPEEKSFFDYRFQLFSPEVTASYLKVRQSLLPRSGAGSEADLHDVFRDRRRPIDHLVVSGSDWIGPFPVVQRLWTNPNEWTMLYMDGRTTIFGWRDPRRRDNPYQGRAFNPEPLAFGRTAKRAPARGAEPPQDGDSWALYVQRPTPRPLALDESALYIQYFYDTTRKQEIGWQARHVGRMLCSQAVTCVASSGGGGWTAFPALLLQLLERPRDDDFGSPAAPLLAVRAARRAVADSPNDPDVYLALAQATILIWKASLERQGGAAPWLDELRHVQTVSALQNALTLRPDSREAHDLLWQIFQGDDPRRSTALDRTVVHLAEWLRLSRDAGPGRDPPEEFHKLLSARAEHLQKLELLLKTRRDDFELKAANQAPLVKAHLALERGLIDQALHILQGSAAAESPAKAFNPQEAFLYFHLLLKTGQLDQVRQANLEAGDWFNVLSAAAAGDYQSADERLELLLARNERERLDRMLRLVRYQMTLPILGPSTLDEMKRLIDAQRDRANHLVLRGLLALERGDTTAAEQHFRAALRLRYSPQLHATLAASLASTNPLETALFQTAAFAIGSRRYSFDYMTIAARYLQLLGDAAADRSAGAARLH